MVYRIHSFITLLNNYLHIVVLMFCIQVNKVVSLPVYKHCTLYLIVRCVSDTGIIGQRAERILLEDLDPMSGIYAYDFPVHYNLDSLHDLLHSSDLGNMTYVLHDTDVDFSSIHDGIAGVVSGVECANYEWSLQVSSLKLCAQFV